MERATVSNGLAPSEHTNTSRIIHKGPCIVQNVVVSGDGSNAECLVYDGENDKGELKAHVEAITAFTHQWTPGNGTLFKYGIYVAVNAVTSNVTVTYVPVEDKRIS